MAERGRPRPRRSLRNRRTGHRAGTGRQHSEPRLTPRRWRRSIGGAGIESWSAQCLAPPDEDATTSAGVRLLTLDRPGCGRSDARPGRSLLSWVDDYVELARQLDSAHVRSSAGRAAAPMRSPAPSAPRSSCRRRDWPRVLGRGMRCRARSRRSPPKRATSARACSPIRTRLSLPFGGGVPGTATTGSAHVRSGRHPRRRSGRHPHVAAGGPRGDEDLDGRGRVPGGRHPRFDARHVTYAHEGQLFPVHHWAEMLETVLQPSR